MKFVGSMVLIALLAACDTARDDEGVAGDTLAGGHPEASAGATDTTHVEATLNEWSVQLSMQTVPPGPVHFMIRNAGRHEHGFEVEGEGIEEEVENIAGGRDATLAVDLRVGTYEVYCPVEDAEGNHKQKGMTTTLTVR